MMFRSNDLRADFERLTRGLDLGAEFDEVIEGISTKIGSVFAGGPGVDAVNTTDAFELYVDLPGVDPAEVEVTVDGHTVTIDADRSFDPGEDAEIVHRGRRHGSFHRSFELSADLDVEQLSARSERGVLILSIPKSASATPRRIQIQTED